jgi:hypothetical protein
MDVTVGETADIVDALKRAGDWMNLSTLMRDSGWAEDRMSTFLGVMFVLTEANEVVERTGKKGLQYCHVECLPPPEPPTRARASGRGRRRGRGHK